MTARSDIIRDRLIAADFATAQAAMRRIIRRAARSRLKQYADRRDILDFDDATLVENEHRTFRQSVRDTAVARNNAAQAAVDIDELLAVYDSIADWIG